ncbi:transcriotion associated factor (nucleomorph) [Cryptomonas paramecium]|uniref:Transcriotion associated factor n=1 Tax=Cryptomonas paramaecium TaxID=2898 RepID=F2HI11_9CRYP|nr:transcriotion associated factor [Cryptomonas paramecium]AEA38957.1 transcriotion associated factor [Cryptomonas paramecium]|mmetsp:Transcript_29356/g.77100  ORF Transcript_29356/g.77100 Transcript_29356/m.77100 type:complete len:393 (-) Transcript_29356:2630-3808(-)
MDTITNCFDKNIITKILFLIGKKNFIFRNCVQEIYFHIKQYIKLLVRNTFKYAEITKKTCISISDIQHANLCNGVIKFTQKTKNVIKKTKKKTALTYSSNLKDYFINTQSSSFNKKIKKILIFKNWFFFKTHERLDFLKSNSCFFKKNLYQHFIFHRFILVKMERGNYLEKKVCLQKISKYKKINNIVLYFVLYLNKYMSDNEISIFHINQVVSVIKALVINRYFDISVYFNFLFPVLIKYKIEIFSRLKKKEFFLAKHLFADIIGIIYNRLKTRNNVAYLKISLIFFHMLFSDYKCIREIYGPILYTTVIGSNFLELLLLPYLFGIIKNLKITLLQFKNSSLLETKKLYHMIMVIVLSYCVKNSNTNNPQIKKIFCNLKDIRYLIYSKINK